MNNFDVRIRKAEAVYILDLSGELDAHTASQFENILKSLMEDGVTKVVVNFKKLDYIASAGLGVLMAYIEDFREKDGDIKLSNMSDRVFKVFDLLGFPTLYEIVNDESEAIRSFEMH